MLALGTRSSDRGVLPRGSRHSSRAAEQALVQEQEQDPRTPRGQSRQAYPQGSPPPRPSPLLTRERRQRMTGRMLTTRARAGRGRGSPAPETIGAAAPLRRGTSTTTGGMRPPSSKPCSRSSPRCRGPAAQVPRLQPPPRTRRRAVAVAAAGAQQGQGWGLVLPSHLRADGAPTSPRT